MLNCFLILFLPQFLLSVTLTTQSPLPQTSSVFLHVELSFLHTVLENTFIRHCAFFWGAKIPACWLQVFFFFFWQSQECFLTVLISAFINIQYINAANITSWTCNLPELLCDKLQTSSVRRGRMFTRVSNLIAVENREKTSKCNLAGCKATGHSLGFYGMGQGGSSEAI